jgi:hypothetical protein
MAAKCKTARDESIAGRRNLFGCWLYCAKSLQPSRPRAQRHMVMMVCCVLAAFCMNLCYRKQADPNKRNLPYCMPLRLL